ncbi:energy-coupling factor ABC transporter ATP-binding protein [Clostridium sp. Marseille-P299]|uniref:energy-coupling factor ABC transporter ATP-binding protein n=1 Tax=Clostridium sp. Marseille-P299 TaxID=1805477 RepID=UPI00083235F2|nr:ABC transporter ATP-binding protein [Clostridium sp. Marseille-P299]
MKECILELKNASVSYDGEHQALHNINVKINKEERIAVLGNNGAGKSTFFLCLNGVLPLQNGELIINEYKIKRQKKDLAMLREKVGFVFQDPDSQMIATTVESEISFGLMNRNLPKEEVKNRINQILQELDLDKLRKTAPHYLSGGEKKRVSIADILVMNPEVLLLDEPTASLDGKNIRVFEEILKGQSLKGITILSSTHDINFAWKWANRILVFHEGEIIADDIPEKIFANEELLVKASLKKPALYQFTELICKKFNKDLPFMIPKDEKQLEGLITQVSTMHI